MSKLVTDSPSAINNRITTSRCIVDRSDENEKVDRICGPSGSMTGKSGEQCCSKEY